MDVSVDSAAFDEAKKIISKIDALEKKAAQIKNMFIVADEDFLTVNSITAQNNIANMHNAIMRIQDNLKVAKQYIEKLQSAIEKYNEIRY